MKKTLVSIVAGLAVVASAHAADLRGSGASFPYAVYQQWTKAYYKATGIKVDYISKGSSKGIKDIKARQTDFGGSDKPLSPKALKKFKLYQFPSVVGAITMGYNVPGIADLKLSRAAIAAIALGKVKYWDDKLITSANPNIALPHKKLTFVHRADGSGTTFNFTYFLSKVSKEWRKHYGAKKSVNWPGDQHVGGNKNSGVASLIKQTPYSVGYIDYADAKNNGIVTASVENKEGEFIAPELQSFQIAAAKANLNPKRDFYAAIADPKGKGAYPIVAATFILLPKEKKETNKKVTKFFDWCYVNGKDIASKLGYVPLPDPLVKKVRAYWSEKGIR
ncbi:Phosphate ABC transporter, periplasmic phosphate-binding protein PstS (TC 3.A.1.7.1) [hydrothermal vent metagenome]|uniref:Phosphate ABC transporter, periplasmic phosphate-binding protein PstS (TC 3.A.1.7.1) n=1 Tax=hydrothermal vent metagenome TaxID=652676 RepID=A0A1W1C4K2_9ZZZZ